MGDKMKQYSKLKDMYKGSPLLVCGNGPSLKDVPVELFKKYPVMGSNSVYTHQYLNDNPVDWYVLEGLGHLKTEEERNARIPYIRKVAKNKGFTAVNRRAIQYFQHLDNVYTVDYVNERGQQFRNFDFNPFLYFGSGHCVTAAMLQLAYFLTTGPVLLVGLDHKFSGNSWHYYEDELAPEFVSMPKSEYQKFRMRVDPFFEQVASVYKETDRKLINLTPKSEARMFTAGEYKDWI